MYKNGLKNQKCKQISMIHKYFGLIVLAPWFHTKIMIIQKTFFLFKLISMNIYFSNFRPIFICIFYEKFGFFIDFSDLW